MKKKWIKSAAWLSASAVMVIIDQISKQWARTVLAPRGAMPLIDGVISLRYAENTGAAFSAFSGARFLLIGFSLAVCIAVAIYIIMHPEMNMRMQLPLSMILAGGVGNLVDRIACGYVVDFFEFQFVRFAIFNVADVFITVGAALLFIVLLCGGDGDGRVES